VGDNFRGRSEIGMKLSVATYVCALASLVYAQSQCPHFEGPVQRELENEARWLVNPSVQKQIAKKSIPFGHLISFWQCNFLRAGLLREDPSVMQGPYFRAGGYALKSLIGRYRGTWTMAITPADMRVKMPDANLLRITNDKWFLIRRDKNGSRTVLATGSY
jgi:hypothetical protein